MFKKIFIIAMAVFFYAGDAPEASVIDAPHDINSGVTCGSCHSYSLWWRYAPTNQSISPSKNKIDNEVCNNCHDGSKAQIPAQSAHSSAIIIPPNHGTWESACVDCHDPHFQGQLDWVDHAAHTYPAGLYLVKGTIGALAAGAVANTTNLGYVPDANLTGAWADRSRWGQKNANPNFDRGLILVVDINNDKNSTYQVVAADDSVITVKGTVEPVEAGKSFGLIYGQMIRQVISTPLPEERPVRFFDPNTLYAEGGFTDQRTPRQGLCQVCHLNTTHWTQDALHDGHNANQKCTNCHDAAQGFKPALPAHGFLVNTSPCTNCHQHQESDPLAMHGNSCFTCHSTPPLLRTDVGNFGHVTRIGRDPAGIPLGDGKTATACTYCHTAYFGGHTHNHTSSVAANLALTPTTANCQGCHPASVSPFVGVGEAHAISGCATCHDLTSNGALQGAAANATAPYGECVQCHVGYFTNHEHGASGGSRSHAVSLGADAFDGKSCATCHNNSNGALTTWNDVLVEHQGNCGFCHNAGRATNVRPPYTSVADVISQADAQHPVTCLDCHASHTNDHQGRYVSAYEDADQPTPVVLTTCAASCHSSTFAVNATDPKLHRTCQSCHAATATPVTLQGSAIGKTVPEANPFNNCYTCHGADYFLRHANVNHSGQGVVTATSDNTCERCHAGDTITSASIHNDKCYLCHDLDRGGVLISLAASGAGNCQACHGNNWLAIHATLSSVDHSQAVTMATVCSACHANAEGTLAGMPVDPQNQIIHKSCSSCHDAQGLLLGLAVGHGGGADCQACHGSFGGGVHDAVDHANRVAMAQACSFCHVGANGTASGIVVDGANPPKHHTCASCHGETGALIGAASGQGATNSCESCHGLFAVRHGGQSHATTVAMATDCSGCHAGAEGLASGITVSASDHQKHYSCSSCHDTSGALAGIAAGQGGGADCNSCHGSFASQHGGVTHAAKVSLSPACANCHAGTEGTPSGMPTSGVDNTKHDDCSQCHGLDGVLVGAAAGHGATNACADCHAVASQHLALHFVQINETTDRGLSTNQACNACHGQDGTDAGLVALDTWPEILALHGAGNCAVCHGTNREVVDNLGQSQAPVTTVADVIAASANPTTCLACHLDKQQPAEHGFDHLAGGIVAALARCVTCHPNPNLLTGIHAANGCTTCHDKTTAPVTLKGSAVGHGKAEVLSAGVPNTCGTCHSTRAADFLSHVSPDHVARGFVLPTTNGTCDNCHNEADTINGGTMHRGACANCHIASPGGATDGTLTGSAAGQFAGGTCTTCHVNTWLLIHQGATPAIGHLLPVGMALECSSCHAGADGTAAGMPVDGLDPRKHQGCSSCHDGNGELISKAAGNLGPNTCCDCHGSFSGQHAQTDHAEFVAMALDCSGCHSAVGNTVDPNNPMVHDSCAQCHGTDGRLIGSGAGHSGGGSCNTCHGNFATVHASTNHSDRVALAVDCADCHAATAGSAAGIPVSLTDPKLHAACSQCHGETGILTGLAAGKEGASSGSPNDCVTCHGVFASNHATVNHNSMVSMHSDCAGCHAATGNTVLPGDPKAHQACTSCHAANGRLRGVAEGKDGTTLGGLDGGGDCVVCHGGFVTNHANVNHDSLVAMAIDCSGCHTAIGNTVNPIDPKVHAACSTCHNANGSLAGSALGHLGGGTCHTCHGSFATRHASQDHSALVSLATDCSGCHSGAQGTASGIPVAGSPKQHSSCASCHGLTGALVSIAVGQGGGADCDSCHGTFAEKHGATDHAFRVALATNCADCHTGAQGGLTGVPTSSLDNKRHDNCAQCHGTTGTLVGSAAGKEGAAIATPNDCSTCHGGFVTNHANVDHASRVSMATDCSACHTAIGNTVNPNDPKVHDACAACHNANGSLAGAAAGHLGGGSCNVCHDSFASIHATRDHSSLASLSTDCAGCHTGSQGTATGMPVGGSNKQHGACASCHGTTGALVSIAVGKGGGAECDTCHGVFADTHQNADHSFRVSAGTNCLDCHAGTAGNGSGIPLSLTDHKVHEACSQCHGTTGTLIGLAAGKEGASSGAPNDCATCHGGFAANHAAINHETMVSMAAHCTGCHIATGNTVNQTDPRVHDDCTSCHGLDGRLIKQAAGHFGSSIGGTDGGGECTVCHGEYLPNHQSVEHNFRSISFGGELICSECHTSDPSHLGFVGGGTLLTQDDVNALHSRPTGDGCALCHYYNEATQANAEGLPLGSTVQAAIVNGTNASADATCVVCHGYNQAQANHHTEHSYRVALDPNCADCHPGTAGSVTGIPLSSTDNKVHDACGQCHGTTGVLTGSAAGKEGASSGTPNNCATCHGGFGNNHANVNHTLRVSMSTECSGCHTATGNTVNPNDPKVHAACASCHAANGSLTGSAANHAGGGQCTVCHGGFTTIHANANHASRVSMSTECSGCHTAIGSTVDPADPKVHTACASCHSATGTLRGSATGHLGGGSCTTCHGEFAGQHATHDHSALITLSTDCSGCHDGAQGASTGMPVGGASMKHSACASCHGDTGVLVSLAAGKSGGAECDSCHGLFAVKHGTANHSFRVALSTDCADCHSGTEGAGNGMAVNAADPKKHSGCAECHGATGALIGLATGQLGATIAAPNTCNTCHGLFVDNHAEVNHGSMVKMDSNEHCSGCHTASGNTVDPNDPRVHDACTSCHGADGRLINLAADHNGGSNGGSDGGGDCITCHGEYLPNHQSVDAASSNHNQRSITYDGGLNCTFCHSSDTGTVGVAGTGELLTMNDVDSLHSRPTGDPCALCHYYNVATQANPQGLPLWNQVRDAIVNGTNGTADATCVICHDYNQTDTGHWYHGTNQAPHFSPTTFTKPEASLNTAYVGETIAGSAVDPESDAITYSKVSGPAWLTVATDGTLGGTPTMAGMDSFVVAATATGGIGYATLTVTVVTPGN